ncbi:sugar ABC transporter ATP-binding protein [Lichenihabitans psoromatis]|uniref:sugar ABC transporter ATP-binding protein n=1 Tax=Lichenihabitans psoromatis TaxID=2528642 RepID=UPI001FDF5AF1|nr:sugar ABC transporter ATP-binding protein [Lichenihabitans psoromatis]
MTAAILDIKGITKRFGETAILHGIDLTIRPGEIIGLIGENGAGKSTLMNIIAGKLRPTAGTLTFDGVPMDLDGIGHGQALGVRFVHQELSTAGSLSVAENIFLGRYLANKAGFVDRKRLNAEARRVLARVGLDAIEPGVRLGTLRSGEQQLVELAKAIAEEPRLLILDEPTSSLTPVEGERLFSLAHELAAKGTGLIFITHRLEEALAHCDRIVVLRDGRLIVDLPARTATKSDLILHMVGRPTTFAYRPHGRIETTTRLIVRNLADASHLKGIDLEARGGEVVGLFGLVGAGRTEFLETLYGYRAARSGSVTVDGAPLALGRVGQAVRRGLFMLPEGRKTRGILPTHSVRRNISVSGLFGFSRLGFVNRRAEAAAVRRLSAALNIRMADDSQPITALSGGNQQKALFARALLAAPKVLLLDEPTHGVDVGAKAEIYDIISRLAAAGTTVLMASSELPEILAVADRCLVFAGGRIAADLDRAGMSEESILAGAFASAPSERLAGSDVHG